MTYSFARKVPVPFHYRSFLILFLFLFPVVTSFAQMKKGDSFLSFSVGWNTLRYNIVDMNTMDSRHTERFYSITPVFMVKGSHKVHKILTLNTFFSFQSSNGRIDDYRYTNRTVFAWVYSAPEDVEWTYREGNVGLGLMFDYGVVHGFEVYGGLQTNFRFVASSTNTTDPDWKFPDLNGPYYLQVIPIAFRGYFNDYLAFNLEVGMFNPFVVAGGIGLKIPSKKNNESTKI